MRPDRGQKFGKLLQRLAGAQGGEGAQKIRPRGEAQPDSVCRIIPRLGLGVEPYQ